MALCPFAVVRLLPENDTQPEMTPTQFVVHTAVDQPGPTSLYPFFSRHDVKAESHFFIRNDGVTEQYMDTSRQANANRYGDVRAISVETEDDGDPEGNPWTAGQVAALVRLAKWAHDTHGIPLALCEAWDLPGLGYHSMWGFKDPVNKKDPINNPWSIYRGKTCPGRTRTIQFLNEVLPRLTPSVPAEEPGDDGVFLVYVQDWDHWYLNAPAGLFRIADWGKVAFWRDANKVKVNMVDPKTFEAAFQPVLKPGVL